MHYCNSTHNTSSANISINIEYSRVNHTISRISIPLCADDVFVAAITSLSMMCWCTITEVRGDHYRLLVVMVLTWLALHSPARRKMEIHSYLWSDVGAIKPIPACIAMRSWMNQHIYVFKHISRGSRADLTRMLMDIYIYILRIGLQLLYTGCLIDIQTVYGSSWTFGILIVYI